MNSSLNDSAGGRQRCRQWTPIITQQLRLRHLYQIIAYNLVNGSTTDGFHYTLHSTAMSAPFYTSPVVCNSNPKWGEIDLRDLQILACTGFVLRIWQASEICVTWGIHLSGLVYLGAALADVRPDCFLPNTVIFHMRGGFFTSCRQLKADLGRPLPCIDALNVLSTESETRVFKLAAVKLPAAEVRASYSLAKLKQLQALQLAIRNRHLGVYAVRERIHARLNPAQPKCDAPPPPADAAAGVRYEPQLLTMTHLNKMLQEKPTRVQRSEIIKLQKEIEVSRLKNKILQQERDRKSGELRLCKEKFNLKCDENEERSSELMENYRHLSKEMEKLREWKNEYIHQRELLHQLNKKLQSRRRQLMSELLQLYPITNVKEKYYINGIELPHSNLLVDSSEAGLSVALGYCSHLLTMCATFLQIPLRYPIRHFGSRSLIEDHVSPFNEKHKEFPLFSRGKDRILFNNAVYLLNKNIAQYLHALGFKPQALYTTLPNLLLLLQGKEARAPADDAGSSAGSPPEEAVQRVLQRRCSQDGMLRPFAQRAHQPADPILDSIRHEAQLQRAHSPKRRPPRTKAGPNPGLSQILAIPEAVLNKQMSGSTFLTYMRSDLSQLDQPSTSTNSDNECSMKRTNCDIKKQPSIEEGTEMIPNSSVPNAKASVHQKPLSATNASEVGPPSGDKSKRRLSLSVGSFDDAKGHTTLESAGSEPLINVSIDATVSSHSADDLLSSAPHKVTSQYEIQKWLDSGPNLLVQTDDNLYPDEYLGRSVDAASDGNGHLTLRTDALVQRKSFNLVKPKF